MLALLEAWLYAGIWGLLSDRRLGRWLSTTPVGRRIESRLEDVAAEHRRP